MDTKNAAVRYNLGKDGKKPTQGYEDDYAWDLYCSKSILVMPLTFASRKVETELKTAFNEKKYGMKINLRSGVANKTPLLLSNSTGIVEGSYRDTIKILVRNSFIDNRLVDFVINAKGEKVKVTKVPESALREAKDFYYKEQDKLEYGKLTDDVKEKLFKTHVPAGTVLIKRGDRIAQAHLQEKVNIHWFEVEELPESQRGEGGLGSSGSN